MPRKARITGSGLIHHIMARGIDGRDIFMDDSDREQFTSLFSYGINKYNFRCYAWSLISNHYHLLLRTSEHPLSEMMRRLNSTYAKYYNRKYKRKWYLFQDRYKTSVTQDQYYLEELVRYIHLNPLRAGICTDLFELEHYTWSGHSVLLGNHAQTFQDTRPVLRRFGKTIETSRENYRRFIFEGVQKSQCDTLKGLFQKCGDDKSSIHYAHCWVIGDKNFVQEVLKRDKENRLRVALHQKVGFSLQDVGEEVSAYYAIQPKMLKKRSRDSEAAEARKVFAYLCREKLGYQVNVIAEYIGLSSSATSICIANGEKIVQKKSPLNQLFNLRP